MPLIGSHATVAGGLATGGLGYAAEVGAEVIRVFVSSPRGWAAVQRHPKAGLCLDTCHLFAAGHDLTAPGGVAAMLDKLGTAAGPATETAAGTSGRARPPVRLVHANDSLLGCGSKRDRHEAIGAGQIGTGPFRELLAALPDVPFVVETPGGKAGHARDIATLRGLR